MLNFKKRVREITLKSSSLSGVINISNTKKSVQFESSLERDYIFLLEFDNDVFKYLEQPLEILYKDNEGKSRKYTPDFAVSFFSNRPNEIVEIKYEETLRIKQNELKIKFDAAKKFCKKNGYIFKVVTENYIRKSKKIELDNYKFLSRYRDYFTNIRREETAFPNLNPDVSLLQSVITRLKKTTIQELVNESTSDELKKAELIFLTWYLIASKLIQTDLEKKLSLNSIIWLD